MKFIIEVIDANLNTKQWTYDNTTNIYRNECGDIINTIQSNNNAIARKSVYFTKTTNPNKWTNDVDELEISLGLNCNLNCEYCSQKQTRNQGYNSKPSDVPSFIDKLISLKINTSMIRLWGGEPLVYWKTIEVLVPELRKIYPASHTKMLIVTNGTLLDEEKFNFFTNHSVQLEISDDGNNVYRNDEDVKQRSNLYDLMEKYSKTHPTLVKFNACVSRGNSNIIDIIESLKSKVPSITKIRTANVLRIINEYDNDEMNKLVAYMPDSDLISMCFSRCAEMLRYYSLNRIENNNIWSHFMTPNNISNVISCGTASGRIFILDLRGDIYPCHCKTTPQYAYGNIENYKKITAVGFTHVLDRERCKNCPFVHACRGNCPHVSENAHNISCDNRYASYFGYMKGLFAKNFNVYINSITPEHPIQLNRASALLNPQ